MPAHAVRYFWRMDAGPRPLMLGMGWFPSTLGGLDRYYRALFEHLPGARAVVIGPAEGAPAGVCAVSSAGAPLPVRLWAYGRAVRALRGQTDLLDAHFALYAAGPLLLHRRRGPTVFHFHGPWAQESVAAERTSGAGRLLRRLLERRVLRAADAHVVLSAAFRRVLVEDYGIAPWEIHVWPPGVALDRFSPGDRSAARVELGLAEGAFAAVCVRRLVPRMGIEALLDAWAGILPALPAGSALLIVGEGPLAPRLAELASADALAGSVRLLGRVSDEQLARAYRAADVAVVPTLAIEGFGLVVLEAAACGTPSVVTDVGGLREAAAPLDRSLVVPAADTPALAARLRAASAGELPSRAATREHAERHSWETLAERHRALYARLSRGAREERLRVVYLDHVARLSGGEIALLRLLPFLAGVQPHVILGEDGPLAARLQQEGISVEVLPFAESARELRRDAVRPGAASPAALLHTAGYTARLARRLRRLQPDLVHTNSLKSGVYGGLAAKAARVPLVWHLRDRIARDYLPGPAVAGMRAMIGALADGVIANSEATLATLPERVRARGIVIADSVDATPLPREARPGPVVFGMLGRIAPWKGQDLFLRAFAGAFPDGPELAVIVGEPMFGEQDFEGALRALADELGIAGRVEFRGFREDVWAQLASFDVLVHASVIPEPFGQVVIEGMAAGTAVIAPDEGGPAEVIANGQTGLLFKARDETSLATAMCALAEDPGARERLGAAALQTAAEYHPRRLGPRFEELYASVLARR